MTGAPSRTAELMAVQRDLESLRPARSRLFCDPFSSRFVSTRWRIILAACHVPGVRGLVEAAYDRVGGPGPRASAIARTRFIDDLLIGESESATQLVIMGAGLTADRIDSLDLSTSPCSRWTSPAPNTSSARR
jgi:O-methyltransferase involved in polyketide biosynthesis